MLGEVFLPKRCKRQKQKPLVWAKVNQTSCPIDILSGRNTPGQNIITI